MSCFSGYFLFCRMSTRAPRPKTCHFRPEKLGEVWETLLKLRDPGFEKTRACASKLATPSNPKNRSDILNRRGSSLVRCSLISTGELTKPNLERHSLWLIRFRLGCLSSRENRSGRNGCEEYGEARACFARSSHIGAVCVPFTCRLAFCIGLLAFAF